MLTPSKSHRASAECFPWILVLGLLPLTSLSCTQAPPEPESQVTTVVLVTIDTWRRDATGFLGALDPSPTPFLDGLASRGTIGADAVAPVPQTGPSHWSILSGRWPWRDDFRTNGDTPREGHARTLPRILHDEGWSTAAFVSCAVLDSRFGFAEGFDHYDDVVHKSDQGMDPAAAQRRGDLTVQSALTWAELQEPDRHTFVWVHLFDPHYPYDAPTGALEGDHGDYLGEVAFADAQVKVLHDGLAALGRTPDKTLWAVISDHGEGLGEHGEDTHSFLLHGATTRIPFLLAGPGVPRKTEQAMLSTVDIHPTLLTLLGYKAQDVDGVDVLGATLDTRRGIPMETYAGLREFGLSPVLGLRTKQWFWEGSMLDRLWNTARDPHELIEIADEQPQQVEVLRKRRRLHGTPAISARSAPQSDLESQLQALGYAGGNLTQGEGDPREYVRTGEKWRVEAMTLLKARDYKRAEQGITKFLESYPTSPSTWVEGGFISLGLNELIEAERRFRMATELDRTSTRAQLNLANTLFMLERLPDAEVEYRGVLDKDPGDLFALCNLGQLQAKQERYDEAAQVLSTFLELYPDHEQAAGIGALLVQWKQAGKY